MERADSRCLVPASVESVSDQRVSLWKARPEPKEVSLDSLKTIAITIAALAAVVALSRWILARTAAGDFLPGQIFALTVMASPFVAFVLILASKRKRTTEVEPTVPSCAEFPRAVPVRVALSTGGSSRGFSEGWLSVDDGLLVFRGEYFDFALRPEDFKKPEDLLVHFGRQGAAVVTPKGVSPQYVRVQFLAREGEQWIVDEAGKERFRRDLEGWANGRPHRAPLFPPLRTSRTPVRTRGLLLGFGGVGLVLSLMIWQLPFLLGTEVFKGRDSLGIAAAVFAFMMMIPIQLAMVAKSINPADREVEKVLEGERKRMAMRSE
jgi:hypothetical protein